MHHPAERFLVVLVLDGVLERHPTPARRGDRDGRRLGAGDARPPRPRRAHLAAHRAAPGDVPAAARPSRPPPSCASRRTRSRTSAGCARSSDPRLYLFSSDYPHAEGGRDPLGRFERSLDGADPATIGAFLAGNASEWLGVDLAA